MKRICVVTTNGLYPLLIQSVFTDGELTFGEQVKLPMQRGPLMTECKARLPKLIQRGDTVLVDEYSGTLAKAVGAKQVTLAMKGANDVPVIVAAFGLYWEMKNQRAILLPASNSGAYEVPRTLVNEVHNQKGEISYQVDWENIRAEQYLMLLSVYATSFNDVGSAAYIRDMLGRGEKARTLTTPLDAIIQHHENLDAENIGKSMAGQKLSDNEWVL